MAKVPQYKRLLDGDFPGQSDWIGRLLGPINLYFEQLNTALNKSLTFADNLSAAFKTVELNGQFPVKLSWDLAARPISVVVGSVYRSDGTAFSQPDSVQVLWAFNQQGQLQINDVRGLLPKPKACSSDNVTASADSFFVPLHEFTTGMKVTLSSTDTAPAGLTAGNSYFVIRTDDHNFKLASLYADALSGIAINITDSGTGTHILKPVIYKKFKLLLECKTG